MAKFSLSSLHTFVSGFEDQPFWIGIDVHKRSYYIALRRSDGRCATWVTPADPDTFAEQVFRLGIAIAAVAYESGPTGFVPGKDSRTGPYSGDCCRRKPYPSVCYSRRQM